MNAYGWIATKFDTGFIVKIISEDGYLLSAFEGRSFKKAPEIAQKFCPKNYSLEWLSQPWSNQSFKNALNSYTANYGIQLDGRDLQENKPW